MEHYQGYDVGRGRVTIGTKVICCLPGERALGGTVTDLTQDGDVTVQPDAEPDRRFVTKWRYVFPRWKETI